MPLCRPAGSTRVLLAVSYVTLTLSAMSNAEGAQIFPKDQHALLEYSFSVETKADAKDSMGGYQKWTAQRSFSARLEVEAKKPVRDSIGNAARDRAAASQGPSVDMLEYQKKMQACGGDMQCQMALSMQMMNSSETQAQINATEQHQTLPLRYQTWTAAKGGRVEVKATLHETTDTLVVDAEKDHTECTYSGEYSAADFGGKPGGTVEVDSQTGTSQFIGLPNVSLQAQKHCTMDFGPQRESTSTQYLSFLPTLDLSIPVSSGGMKGGGNEIAKGEAVVEGTLANTAKQNEPVPVRIKLQWKLTPL